MKIRSLWKSFRHAFHGVVIVLHEEQNFRIQLVCAVLVFVLAYTFRVRPIEGAVLALVIGCVLVLELINSVVERLIDVVKPRVHPYIAELKDIAAGAVLVAACTAVIVALYIFVPYFIERI